MGFFNKIIYACSTNIQDESLKSRVASSNLVALFLLVVACKYISIRGYFAYDRDKHLEEDKIMPSEGLIEKCYLEAEKYI